MNSVLGTIQLGTWQLGQVSITVTTGSFTATANPTASAAGVGGVQRPFTSVVGTIQLGLLQLGQIPAGSVTSGEPIGIGSFMATAFPIATATAPPPTGSFTAAAYPTAIANGNRGPLLVILSAYPAAAAAGIFYYADGSFTCSPCPTATAQGVQVGAVVFTGYPIVTAAPIGGQQLSCVVGSETPEAVVGNFAY